MKRLLMLFFWGILLSSCARVGSPVGGDKDTIAPNFLKSNIDTTRVKVKTTIGELRLDFDEYITLKDIQKNLVISPPIKKIKKILPGNLSTKYVLIQWADTLQANTTYNFNFGNSIQDNNEGNTARYFNYAFSTGDKLDDLYISGEVTDIFENKKTSENKSKVVALYKEKDTINYREKPYYLTKVDDDGYFELNYIAKGKYRILAFEDENGNSIYDPGKEKIAFQKDPIAIDSSVSGMQLKLFPSKKEPKYKEMKSIPGGILMLFEGKPKEVKVKSLSEKLKEYRVTHQPFSDSVNIWFDAIQQNIGVANAEKLDFNYEINGVTKSVSFFGYKKAPKSELVLTSATKANLLEPNAPFTIQANHILDKIDTKDWKLTLDSLSVQPFKATVSDKNPYKILITSNFEEGKKYQFTLQKNTISSFYASNDKPYRFDFEVDKIQNFGKLTLYLKNAPTTQFWIQLLNSQDEVEYMQYTQESVVEIPLIKPGEYKARILVDENQNGVWEEADLQRLLHAEEAYIFPKTIVIRPLWTMKEDWDLKQPNKNINSTPNTLQELK